MFCDNGDTTFWRENGRGFPPHRYCSVTAQESSIPDGVSESRSFFLDAPQSRDRAGAERGQRQRLWAARRCSRWRAWRRGAVSSCGSAARRWRCRRPGAACWRGAGCGARWRPRPFSDASGAAPCARALRRSAPPPSASRPGPGCLPRAPGEESRAAAGGVRLICLHVHEARWHCRAMRWPCGRP
jgi:hypothetical protein